LDHPQRGYHLYGKSQVGKEESSADVRAKVAKAEGDVFDDITEVCIL
jgi:hypothetical protein